MTTYNKGDSLESSIKPCSSEATNIANLPNVQSDHRDNEFMNRRMNVGSYKMLGISGK